MPPNNPPATRRFRLTHEQRAALLRRSGIPPSRAATGPPTPAAPAAPAAKSLKFPRWAALAARRQFGWTGLGDAVHALATTLRADRLVAWLETRTRWRCACTARRARWNRRFPFPATTARPPQKPRQNVPI